MCVRVLLADDKEIIRNAIRRLLDENDQIKLVGEATDFSETIQLTKDLNPDVVVMDLSLPDRSRGQGAKQMSLGEAKLLAMSLANDDEAAFRAESLGAVKLLDKMKLFDDLVPAILRYGAHSAGASAG